jgi:hypothetical protein
MPAIHRIGSARIVIFPRDHFPPHVHVIQEDREGRVAILTGEKLSGRIQARTLARLKTWLAENRNSTLARWNQLTE